MDGLIYITRGKWLNLLARSTQGADTVATVMCFSKCLANILREFHMTFTKYNAYAG